MADSCVPCLENKPANQKETLVQDAIPARPWEKIGCDLFTIEGWDYLVAVDYISNFIEVDAMPSTTSRQIILSIKKMCSRFGRPKQLVSDGGPQFSSLDFKSFMNNCGIEHIISSPYHAKSNGKAEAAVKTIKGMMKKCIQTGSDQYLALMELRNTPQQDSPSPAFLMFGRHLNTNIPRKQAQISDLPTQRSACQKAVKKYYNKNAKD